LTTLLQIETRIEFYLQRTFLIADAVTRYKRSPLMDVMYPSISYRVADSNSKTLLSHGDPDLSKLLEEMHHYSNVQSIDPNHLNSIDKDHPYYSVIERHFPYYVNGGNEALEPSEVLTRMAKNEEGTDPPSAYPYDLPHDHITYTDMTGQLTYPLRPHEAYNESTPYTSPPPVPYPEEIPMKDPTEPPNVNSHYPNSKKTEVSSYADQTQVEYTTEKPIVTTSSYGTSQINADSDGYRLKPRAKAEPNQRYANHDDYYRKTPSPTAVPTPTEKVPYEAPKVYFKPDPSVKNALRELRRRISNEKYPDVIKPHNEYSSTTESVTSYTSQSSTGGQISTSFPHYTTSSPVVEYVEAVTHYENVDPTSYPVSHLDLTPSDSNDYTTQSPKYTTHQDFQDHSYPLKTTSKPTNNDRYFYTDSPYPNPSDSPAALPKYSTPRPDPYYKFYSTTASPPSDYAQTEYNTYPQQKTLDRTDFYHPDYTKLSPPTSTLETYTNPPNKYPIAPTKSDSNLLSPYSPGVTKDYYTTSPKPTEEVSYDIDTRAEHEHIHLNDNEEPFTSIVGHVQGKADEAVFPARHVVLNNVKYKVITDTLTPATTGMGQVQHVKSSYLPIPSEVPLNSHTNYNPAADPQAARRLLELLSKYYASKQQNDPAAGVAVRPFTHPLPNNYNQAKTVSYNNPYPFIQNYPMSFSPNSHTPSNYYYHPNAGNTQQIRQGPTFYDLLYNNRALLTESQPRQYPYWLVKQPAVPSEISHPPRSTRANPLPLSFYHAHASSQVQPHQMNQQPVSEQNHPDRLAKRSIRENTQVRNISSKE
jgi:hypothetical protein